LAAHTTEFSMRLPELSNCGCLPSIAGGSPIFTSPSGDRERQKVAAFVNHIYVMYKK
jgi:hypothetical protein